MSYEKGDEVICMRAAMKLCNDPECYHNEPHACIEEEETQKLCTVNTYCQTRQIVTRCFTVRAQRGINDARA